MMNSAIMRTRTPLHMAALAALFLAPLTTVRAAPSYVVMRMDGPIMPPTRDYFARAMDRAVEDRAEALIVEMDTPGGHAEAMREIGQMILNARVPVVVYVTPSGARAASAGAIIGLTAHVLAMAPSTNIGAAHPVLGTGQDIPGAMKDKVVNDMSAFVRGVAKRRGKSVEWAEKIVRKSVANTETEALALGIADLIADNRQDLLRKLNGRKVVLNGGRRVRLNTVGAVPIPIEPTFTERLLLLLFDGNVALILGAIAFYGLVAEVQSPGAVVPGVVGSIALILSLYSLSVLSVNWAGVTLLLLAAVLFVIDIYAASHGVLTAGGIVAFVMGAMMLFRGSPTGAQVSIVVVVSLALVSGGFFAIIVGSLVRSRRMPPGTGPETLIESSGAARTDLRPTGKVFVDGSLWSAVNVEDEPILAGEPVIVVQRTGLTLRVRRAQPSAVGPVYGSQPTGSQE